MDREITHDWFGKPLENPVSLGIELENTTFTLSIKCQAQPLFATKTQLNTKIKPGTFVEGLWEHDVAEAFIKTGKDSYLELNLAPNGAWWAMHFDSYRKPSTQQPKIQLLRQSHESNTFTVSAGFYLGNLNVLNSLLNNEQQQLIGNLCCILGQNPRRYISLHTPPADLSPDFHDARLFATLAS